MPTGVSLRRRSGLASAGVSTRSKGTHGLLFGVVAVIWGTPYALIKLALDGFSPEFVAWARIAAAAVALAGVVGLREMAVVARRSGRPVAVLAVLQFAVPLVLIAYAEQRVTSAMAGILIASEPLWVAILALRLDRSQRASWRGLLGVLIGLLGVVLLLGVDAGGSAQLVSGVLVALAAGCYAAAALWLPRATSATGPLPVIAVALSMSAVALAPLGLTALPAALPSATSVAALAALAGVCTAVAFPLWFALIARAGAARASLITYVSPIVAIVLGAVALGEHLRASAAGAVALIFAGSLLAARDHRPSALRRPDVGERLLMAVQGPARERS